MDKPNFYEIKVKGHLDTTLASWFENLTVSNLEDPTKPRCKACSNASATWVWPSSL